MRIAQLIIEKYTLTTLTEVETLDETVRGAGGFGSTGTAKLPEGGVKRSLADLEKSQS